MNNFSTILRMPSLPQLLNERATLIKNLVANLQSQDISSEQNRELAKKKIKDRVLVEKVLFEEPEHKGHTYERRTLNMSQQVLGQSADQYTHTVSFGFSGDSALFNYAPDGMPFNVSGNPIFQPSYGRKIEVSVTLNNREVADAIQLAKNKLTETFDLIERNNRAIEPWNNTVSSSIDAAIDALK